VFSTTAGDHFRARGSGFGVALRSSRFFPLLLPALLGALACAPERGASSERPNVLLVTLDTVRADRLGSYGYATAATPALDSLARDGARFTQAMASAPLTLPSHATLLTGLLPPRHAVHQNGAGALPAGVPTLAESLRANGYRTGAFVGSFVLDQRFGLGRGFDLYDDDILRDPSTATAGLEAERNGAEVIDRALAWLDAGDERPFFAWVHLYDAHAPYEPPEPYRSRFAGSPYDGEIAAVDAQVARLLARLDERGQGDDTVIAVTADHGESLGEHGELTHGLLLFEPTLRVPLLLRAPGRLRAGLVIDEPVSLVDVAPTLAGLAGATLGGTSAPLDGRDLSAALEAGDRPPRADLYAETEYPTMFGWSALAALRRGEAKYVDAPSPRFYDLEADPGETTNLLAADDPRTGTLAAALAAVRSRRVAPAAAPALDAESREKLASLGYLSAGATSAARPGSGGDPHELTAQFRAFEEAHWATLQGRAAEAVALLRPLVDADPDNAIFRAHLARAYRENEQPRESVDEYRRAFTSSPGDAQVGYELALALQATGEIAEATTVLSVVLRSDGSRPEAHNALGILYSLAGQADDARAEFERALAIDPRDAVVLNNLGNSMRDLRRLDDAAKAYRRAIELAPGYAEPLNGLGSVLVAEGQPDEALPLFDRALRLAPDRHEVRLNRAVALELGGDRAAAIDAYRGFVTASESDPDFAEQREIASRLALQLEEEGPAISSPLDSQETNDRTH